jgi:hypothetical protein
MNRIIESWRGSFDHYSLAAIQRYYELAAELASKGDIEKASRLAKYAHQNGDYESLFKRQLRDVGFDEVRIVTEVRLVRERAFVSRAAA